MSHPSLRHRRRRVAFFFDDYFDPESRILELGPGDGWLGPYLIHAGFRRYRRLAPASPADFVGELGDWQRLGLEPASLEIVVAFDGLTWESDFDEVAALLVPGGRLFLETPRADRQRLAKWLGRLGWRHARARDVAPFDPGRLRGLRIRKRSPCGLLDEWLSCQKPLDSSSQVRSPV